ncbi:MAG TPA: tetratricopeptide repeat protein [Gemmatimonadales bacterium]|nr:tetratricopeptide repeat protein [Gemmatimonadales bacterium]
MSQIRRLIGGLLVTGAALAAAATVARPAEPVSSRPALSENEVLELDIAFYRRRLQRDSLSARDEGELARLLLQRGRLLASEPDLREAERHARRSLRLRTAHNGATAQVLAGALMARHAFAEAREVAEGMVAADSSSRSARAMLGEIELELGDYAAARRTFGTLLTVRTDFVVAPRFARWEELNGQPEAAEALFRGALAQAESRHGTPPSQLAWFHWRLGDLALRNGRADEANAELSEGLEVVPDDPRLLGTMARLSAARHRWREAIDEGERALARVVDPATLGLLSQVYAAVGDSARSADARNAMAVAVLNQPGPFHRGWSLLLLEQGREVPEVLARARAELATRRDVYGWDLLAWSLYRSGRAAEAVPAADRALVLGTRDAMLWYHAGMIRLAAGDSAGGRNALRTALRINPLWDPFQPDSARAALAR